MFPGEQSIEKKGTKPPRHCVVVADDDDDIRELVCLNLQQAGFDTLEAPNGLEASRLIKEHIPSAVVLDVMMPGRDGYEVCRLLRTDPDTLSVPVLMLTARDLIQDRIVGLQLGADDYVTKPFSPKELVLRVQALVKRLTLREKQSTLRVGPFELDLPNVRLLVDGAVSPLTMLEFKLLHLLASQYGSIVPRDTILREVWGYSDHTKTRTLDTHVKRLREKLGSRAEWLQTSRGNGYCLAQPNGNGNSMATATAGAQHTL